MLKRCSIFSKIYRFSSFGDQQCICSFDLFDGYLQGQLSNYLEKKYLLKCTETEEQILSNRKYQGLFYSNRKQFISIPTRADRDKPFFYVHYLINFTTLNTTLTHKALCTLHQRPYCLDQKFSSMTYQIGSQKVQQVQLSNPNPKVDDTPYYNVNMLGRDFFIGLKKSVLEEDFTTGTFELTLEKN